MLLENKYRPDDLFENTSIKRENLAKAIIHLTHQWATLDPFILDVTDCRLILSKIQDLTLRGELTEACQLLVPFCATDSGHFVPYAIKATYELKYNASLGSAGMFWHIQLFHPLTNEPAFEPAFPKCESSSSFGLTMIYAMSRYLENKHTQPEILQSCTTLLSTP